MKYLFLFSVVTFLLISCNLSIENKIQGKWEVIEGGSIMFTKIVSIEFSGGKAYTTVNSLLGVVTTPGEYQINDNKILVGEFIFEFINDNTLETNNVSYFSFKMRKKEK